MSTTVLVIILSVMVLVGTLTTTITVYGSSTSNLNNTAVTMPTAESVYKSETIELPPTIGSFMILIANEAHENWQDEKHNLITDKNSNYIP